MLYTKICHWQILAQAQPRRGFSTVGGWLGLGWLGLGLLCLPSLFRSWLELALLALAFFKL